MSCTFIHMDKADTTRWGSHHHSKTILSSLYVCGLSVCVYVCVYPYVCLYIGIYLYVGIDAHVHYYEFDFRFINYLVIFKEV